MSHTNSTTNYGLPQFLTGDKPAWLTDINNAFSDIDSSIYAAQTKADTAYNDAGAAQGDATTALTNAAAADAKGAGALASIETAFDPTTIYAVGTKVIYNSLLYRCIVAVTTPGPWTGAANWERITVDSIIPGNAGDLAYSPYASYPVGSTGRAITDLVPTAYSTATRSSALSSGALAYVKLGNVVIANLNYTSNTSTITAHDTVMYTGLPHAVSNVYFNFVDEAGNVTRVRVGTDGIMHLHYSQITANKEINGSFSYLAASI